MTELKYKDITEKIIGASFEVHKFSWEWISGSDISTGIGLGINKSWTYLCGEIEQEIFYKELQEPIGTRRADFVVEGKVLVELKAIIELEDVH